MDNFELTSWKKILLGRCRTYGTIKRMWIL